MWTHNSAEALSLKLAQGGETLSIGLAKPHQQRVVPGTTVQVRDLFYQWPVRRKAASAAKATNEAIRQQLEVIALIHPSVQFHLNNQEHASQDGRLNIKPCGDHLSRWVQLWGSALVQVSENTLRLSLPC